ncbi:MAG: copper homeostasis periplasmic binding protein CopC [Mesorhizobium sp.]|jgi:methionine-rich copper-binding protein CopC|uniref:copper homeostasis periplasmic binding protein CopC n=1 Tax=Pseudomonas TaxID=286 RepID=UPI0008766CB3|nr:MULTISPECIES: copper homeostasis periplasmic binding protein CopC [Pseudomonas]TIR87579.1 MAG: copper homeostasis periplasmic binding protein CopC [Mesorhizobium sp.]MDB6444291.1 copper homeostasis periplasmic binding protein CopC [Pseudomonas sp. 21TX0197]MDT8905071.1 copper homeostasis periplasmic binding protein CopC [Pseudomonas prosekii]NHN66839.1 copper homeostasis periplasmic binding protein CopC [Pseudomonas fluorescens]ROO32553.1 copper resistance protein CopC [Pseudomonas sp. 7SR1
MSLIKTAVITVALSAGLLGSGLAQAHPKLLSSNPADGAQGPAPAKIELHFSENLMTKFSGAKLLMTEMPGMSAHSPMAMPAKVSGSDDPKTMVITPNTPLTAGTYQVQWRAVSSDTHPITGNVTFKVK